MGGWARASEYFTKNSNLKNKKKIGDMGCRACYKIFFYLDSKSNQKKIFFFVSKCFKWHFAFSRATTVQNYFEIHA